MKQEITQHHFTEKRYDKGDPYDAPAGGHTFGPGLSIAWQNGPLGTGAERKEPNGCFVETVIEAAIGRLEFYQSGKFRCPENQVALDHLRVAIGALEARTAGRLAKGIEGTHET